MGLTVERLASLQELELQRDAAQQRVREINQQLREPEDLQAARASLTAVEAALQALSAEQTDVDLRRQAMVTRIAGEEKRLYGGTIRSPRELQDLQAEVASLRGQLEDLQLAELDVMERIESAEAERGELQGRIQQQERDWVKQGRALLAEREALRATVTGLEPRIAALRAEVAPGLLGTYDRLRGQKGGVAIARIEGRMCLGCRTDLPESEARAARGTDAVVQCSGCRRLLRA